MYQKTRKREIPTDFIDAEGKIEDTFEVGKEISKKKKVES